MVIVSAVGSNVSCQSKRSAPDDPEKLNESPNGGRGIRSGESMGTVEGVNEKMKRDREIVCHSGNLGGILSLTVDGSNLVIGKGSALWRESYDTDMLKQCVGIYIGDIADLQVESLKSFCVLSGHLTGGDFWGRCVVRVSLLKVIKPNNQGYFIVLFIDKIRGSGSGHITEYLNDLGNLKGLVKINGGSLDKYGLARFAISSAKLRNYLENYPEQGNYEVVYAFSYNDAFFSDFR